LPDAPTSGFLSPPIQRKPLTGTEPSPIGTFVNLGEPSADAYIVRDVTEICRIQRLAMDP
jgi:hypothetical protein